MELRPEPNGALAEILARDQANGVDVFDTGPAPPLDLSPPIVLEPLLPPTLPPPDWRAEERRAAARDTPPAPDPEPPPPESLAAAPAKPRRKPKKPTPTPNLDAWRKLLQEDGR